MTTLKTLAERNPATIAAVLAVGLLVVAYTGCAASIPSTISGEKVTRGQFAVEVAVARGDIEARAAALEAEAKTLAIKAEQGEAEFDRIEGMLASALGVLEDAVVVAAGPYSGLATVGFGILAAGLGIDNRRKDGVIAGQKQAVKALDGATVVKGQA